MDKIQIVNFLLTRRCNLKCSYCRIARDYNRPDEYPPLSHYNSNELSPQEIINFLNKLHKHNPNVFIIFYGGEPFLYNDLPLVIDHCHKIGLFYTIITNNSDEVQPSIEKLFLKVKVIEGLTSSIDPIIFNEKVSGDIKKKSISGLNRLSSYREKVKDLVAEITVTTDTIENLPKLVRELTNRNISSSITFLDISKNNYYDFSTITNRDFLVFPTVRVRDILSSLFEDETLDIHMRDQLLIFPDILPSDLDCGIENDISNITIDADGSIRLCLRIRGVNTPETMSINNIISDDGNLNPNLKGSFKIDKMNYCNKCNWTCMLHSQLSFEGKINDLLHIEKRSKLT